MTFMPEKVTIYSVGLLGGSLGLALKTPVSKANHWSVISSAIETAKRLGVSTKVLLMILFRMSSKTPTFSFSALQSV